MSCRYRLFHIVDWQKWSCCRQRCPTIVLVLTANLTSWKTRVNCPVGTQVSFVLTGCVLDCRALLRVAALSRKCRTAGYGGMAVGAARARDTPMWTTPWPDHHDRSVVSLPWILSSASGWIAVAKPTPPIRRSQSCVKSFLVDSRGPMIKASSSVGKNT